MATFLSHNNSWGERKEVSKLVLRMSGYPTAILSQQKPVQHMKTGGAATQVMHIWRYPGFLWLWVASKVILRDVQETMWCQKLSQDQAYAKHTVISQS